MDFLQLNKITVYAWSDASQAEFRAWWRGFISFFLSTLLEVDQETGDMLAANAVAGDSDTLFSSEELSLAHLVRKISVGLCAFLGLPREFGLAAFLETDLPTRFVQTRSNREKPREEETIRHWLAQLAALQTDAQFQEQCQVWRQEILEILEMQSIFSESQEAL